MGNPFKTAMGGGNVQQGGQRNLAPALLQHIQGGGEISVGLVERLHGVHELVGNLAAKLLGQVPQLRGVVDVVVQHIAEHRHRLLAAVAVLVGVGVVMGMGVLVVVVMVMLVFLFMFMVVFMFMAVVVPTRPETQQCGADTNCGYSFHYVGLHKNFYANLVKKPWAALSEVA